MKTPTLLQRFTPFQLTVAGLLLLSLALNIGVFAVLLHMRAETQPLVSRSDALVELANQGPYVREAPIKVLLALAAAELTQLAEERIQYTFPISQTLRISTDIVVDEHISVPISLVVSHTLPVNVEIPLQEDVLVPVRLEVDQVFSISTTVPFRDEIVVPVDDVIHIDERFEIRVLGQDIEIPIRGDIPVKLNVTVPIDKEFPVVADIPVRFPISETLPVEIEWTIPVDLEIPINLPVETDVIVPFSRTIPISIQAPVVLDVPIDIALSETPLGEILRDLGEQLLRISENWP
jgi:hypothetical protein